VLVHQVERKLAAILAADVAGYSRFMGQDEAGTLARLKEHRRELIDPKIADHKGRIVKTSGDGMLIEFPSVVEAVACAVAVQRGMAERNVSISEDQRIVFRVGINLGDIIVEDADIHGDGVNIAARLEAMAEPGGICVNRVVRDQVRDRLDIAFEDMGEQQVKNIARPVRAYRIMLDQTPRPSDPAAVALPMRTLALPDKPSVAVLPFTNMSSVPEQEYFADGIAEDVITALSRYPSLFVIARNSTFTYKGRAVEIRQIGRELGVRYVLEGSLRKAGNRIRVTAQLIEAETGNHVWAERYDRDLADIFAVQDEISQAVTIAIAPAIEDAERQRAMRKPPGRLDAWTAYQRGLWHMGKEKIEDFTLAEARFQQAIDLDPTFAGGYSGLAFAVHQSASVFQMRDLAEAQETAETLARRAVALDLADAEARQCLGFILRVRGDYQGALAELERAISLNPNLAGAHSELGAALIFAGRPTEGLAALQRSIRLDPRHPNFARLLLHMTVGLYFSREYAAAIEAAKRAIRLKPQSPLVYRWLTAALGQVGPITEAGQALSRAIAVAPASFDMYVRNRVPWMRPEDHAHMLEGLRKAGWEG
jgi:adenylate cyclase